MYNISNLYKFFSAINIQKIRSINYGSWMSVSKFIFILFILYLIGIIGVYKCKHYLGDENDKISNVNKKLCNNGKTGLVVGIFYIATYVNTMEYYDFSIVFYIADPLTSMRLRKEVIKICRDFK